MNKRLTKIEYGVLRALAVSTRSEDPFTKAGAFLTTLDGEPLGSGYNGVLPKMDIPAWFANPERREEKGKLILHAEANLFGRNFVRQPSILYLTMSPCEYCCSRLIVPNQVKEVYYPQLYRRHPSEFSKILDFYGIEHRELSTEEKANVQNGIVELFTLMRGQEALPQVGQEREFPPNPPPFIFPDELPGTGRPFFPNPMGPVWDQDWPRPGEIID